LAAALRHCIGSAVGSVACAIRSALRRISSLVRSLLTSGYSTRGCAGRGTRCGSGSAGNTIVSAAGLIAGAGIRDHTDRADLQRAVARTRSLDLDLMPIMRFQHGAIALQVHGLAVVSRKDPVSTRLLQAAFQ
jgi:hypothetical protein